MRDYDVVIIGGGISGLYAAYKLIKTCPEKTFLILERDGVLGGRMNRYRFSNVDVNTGAGVGRKNKDALLITLLNELGVYYKAFLVDMKYASSTGCEMDVASTITLLRRKYVAKNHTGWTFKKYAIDILGSNDYKCFVTRIGFSDFELQSANDVLQYYGLEDNVAGWVGMMIDWALVIERISKVIGLRNIKMNEEIVSIDASKKAAHVVVSGRHKTYFAKQLIIASTVDTVRQLLPQHKIYRDIHGQSFMRMYGKFGSPIPSVDKTIVVSGPLKKISPIDIGKGVYMIAYTDNAGAEFMNAYSRNTSTNRKFLMKLMLKSLGLDADIDLKLESIKCFYWKIGTHYYSPLKKEFKTRIDFIKSAQNPHPNVLVVGEMVSLQQGWTVGALESVDKVII
jgi:hypothetical protein